MHHGCRVSSDNLQTEPKHWNYWMQTLVLCPVIYNIHEHIWITQRIYKENINSIFIILIPFSHPKQCSKPWFRDEKMEEFRVKVNWYPQGVTLGLLHLNSCSFHTNMQLYHQPQVFREHLLCMQICYHLWCLVLSKPWFHK